MKKKVFCFVSALMLITYVFAQVTNNGDWGYGLLESTVVGEGVSNQVVKKKNYIASYNKDTKCPNWVAWHLTAGHADGSYKRIENFYEEELWRITEGVDGLAGTCVLLVIISGMLRLCMNRSRLLMCVLKMRT